MKEHDFSDCFRVLAPEFAVRSCKRTGAETQGRGWDSRREHLTISVTRERLVRMRAEERSLHLMIKKPNQRASEVGD